LPGFWQSQPNERRQDAVDFGAAGSSCNKRLWVERGIRHGPMPAEELRALQLRGVIGDGALAWRTGMENWEPLGVHFPAPTGAQVEESRRGELYGVTRGAHPLWGWATCGVASVLFLTGAWVLAKSEARASDLISPNLVARAYFIRVSLSALLASAAAMIWLGVVTAEAVADIRSVMPLRGR
jgi:hypothetical protein